MSSIAGFFQPNTIYSKENEFCIKTIHDMSESLYHRGPNEQSFYYFPHGAFNHNFLLAGYIPGTFPREVQPLTVRYHENSYTLFFDGFISNAKTVAMDLETRGVSTEGYSLEKLLLMSFILEGTDFIKRLRGAFAMAIYDEGYNVLYLFRDALGLRPLFYAKKGSALIFASEIKALFRYPGLCPAVHMEGFAELLALGPARRPGSAIFADVAEVKPGHFLTFGKEYFREDAFHHFEIREHKDSYEDTLDNITYLLNRSIDSLKGAVMPVSCLLSGGLDSSVVTAKLADSGTDALPTYSLEFENSVRHFKSNSFQPSLDAPFVQEMSTALGTRHTTFTCDNQTQFRYLRHSVEAHDLPAMADVDSSYLYFCEKVKTKHSIVFTGECADEIFCGYPWYHNGMDDPKTFPWSMDLSPRKCLLKDELLEHLPLKECARDAYLKTCQDIGIDGENTPKELLHQKHFYLTLRYFMQTLINRGDRAAAISSMDSRIPFANQDLAEYLFNVPLEMQSRNGERKSLLRDYAKGLLPESIRTRPKSPYPKTYDPGYEVLINTELLAQLSKPSCPLHALVDKDKATIFCRQVKDLGRPWYGQLMAGPQLVAHYLQILYWLEMYHIEIL